MATALLTFVKVPEPDAGEIVHETPWPDRSLLTVGLRVTTPPACTTAVAGETETEIAENTIVVEPDLLVSATEVAVIVTVTSLAGGVVGAVYVVETPLAVAVGETLPHCAAEQETFQVTPFPVESWLTTAVRDADPPAATEVESADTDTEVAGGATVAELPPPQPVITMSEMNPRTDPTRDGARFIYAPPGSFFREGVATFAFNRREDVYQIRKVSRGRCTSFPVWAEIVDSAKRAGHRLLATTGLKGEEFQNGNRGVEYVHDCKILST